MVVVFANNQTMAADGAAGAAASVINTDPVPLNGNDRATMVLNAQYFFGVAARSTARSRSSRKLATTESCS